MPKTDLELARHAAHRGAILRTLKEDYGPEMTTLRVLQRALDVQGVSLSAEDLEFHLTYLSDQAYVSIKRARDLPGFRTDRPGAVKPSAILMAKLLPSGLQLLDGLIPEDPSVTF